MSNYDKGASFERTVKKGLELDGWLVVRSAGSHGPTDLIGVNERGEVILIQCKLKGAISKDEKESLAALGRKYKARAYVVKKGDTGVVFEVA